MNKREWMLQAALSCVGEAVGYGQEDEWVRSLGALYDAICASSPETPQEGAWVEYDGDVGTAPVEDAEVVVEFRSGHTQDGHGGDFAWDHTGDDMDIVRWRYA